MYRDKYVAYTDATQKSIYSLSSFTLSGPFKYKTYARDGKKLKLNSELIKKIQTEQHLTQTIIQ